jgi:Ser/Thr protein kinase RdoA (MazF antagonist)
VTGTVGAVLTRPAVDVALAADVLRLRWAIEGELRPLPSERDRNFAVRVDGADAFVLKISNGTEDPAFLEMQHGAMRRLSAADVPCQLPVLAADGADVISAAFGQGREHLVRVLTWLPGRPLASVPPDARPPELLEDLGRTMGRTAAALDGFDHPAAHRAFQWEASQGLGVIDAHAAAVTDPDRRALLGTWRAHLARLPDRWRSLRAGVIHNDANDHNVLVADDHRSISGLLDLGDAVWSVTVNELAVAAAYAALDAADPLPVIGAVRRGFETELPLTDDEASVVLDLVALRLCTSVALSAHQSALAPDDPYLTVSEAPAWSLLERLAAERAK